MKIALAIGTCAVLLLGAGASFAQELNTSELPPAGAQTSINKARARGNLMGQGGSAGVGFGDCPTDGQGNVSVGNVRVPPGTRAPREVITVITGDVSNVSKGPIKQQCR